MERSHSLRPTVTLKMDYGMLHCIFCAEPLDPPVLKVDVFPSQTPLIFFC